MRFKLVSLLVCTFAALPVNAQDEKVTDARDYLPPRLVDALEWSVPDKDIRPDPQKRIIPWQVCRFCALDAENNVVSTFRRAEFLVEVTSAVREAVGFAKQPKAPDLRPEVISPEDGLRGAVIVRPVQDSKISGFWSYRLRMEGEQWVIDTAGISTRPTFDEEGKLVSNNCRQTKQLSGSEKLLIFKAANPRPLRAHLFGQPDPLFGCMDGGPTMSEISYVHRSGGDQEIASKFFIRECGMDDDITQFNETIEIVGNIGVPVSECIWRDAN